VVGIVAQQALVEHGAGAAGMSLKAGAWAICGALARHTSDEVSSAVSTGRSGHSGPGRWLRPSARGDGRCAAPSGIWQVLPRG
jgi:hypothetical protein